MDGVTVLDKKQQSKVSGGQTCYFHIDGRWVKSFKSFAEGEKGSLEAEEMCVDMIYNKSMQMSSCRYDCMYDGKQH